MLVRTFPFVPADPLSLWTSLHPRPQHGFYLGSGVGSERDHIIAMSAGEPRKLIPTLPPSVSKNRNSLPRFVGFLGFEAGRLFDPGLARLPKKPNPLRTPDILFGEYLNVVRIDLKKGETTIGAESKRKFDAILDGLKQSGGGDIQSHFRHTSVRPNIPAPMLHFKHISQKEFSRRVLKAKAAIARGDIYQANLSIRFERAFHGDPLDLYRNLSEKNPSPYAALIKAGPRWIVSCSPELLISVEGKALRTRPIAGTRPRGVTASHDARLKGQLLLSPKERAEHIMLVDLERNDLGRVGQPGSVRVKERFAIERYSHVMHIVSEVEGRLANNKSAVDALRAVFPGGTITGCPKISSVGVIEKLEGVARGPFYGSAGYFSADGSAKFNILIRTALIQNKKVYVQAGAGIVADSKPHKEYKETLAKAQALLESITSCGGV